MSLDFWVVHGNIPATGLKSAIQSGKIKGVKLIPQKGKYFAIQYDKKGIWNAEEFYKGNVTWFVEYAGGHGTDKAQDKLKEQLEKTFKCEITMDEDEYARWVKKSTGKALPKDPHAGCDNIVYTKEFSEGKCMDIGKHIYGSKTKSKSSNEDWVLKLLS